MGFIASKEILKEKYDGCILSAFKDAHCYLNLYNRPETYLTLLKDRYGNNSETLKLKRKVKELRKRRIIYDDEIPIAKGRTKLFYIFEKTYFLVYTKNNIYYCDKIIYLQNNIELKDVFRLEDANWIKVKNMVINMKEVIKCF